MTTPTEPSADEPGDTGATAPVPPPPPPPPPPPAPPFFAGAPSELTQGYPQQGYPQQGYPPPGYAPQGYPPPGPGAPWNGAPPYGYQAFPQNSGRAIAVLVLGITSLVLLCAYGIGIVPAIIGLALAPGARREIEMSGGRIIGEGLLRAGVICSWVAVGLTLIGVLVVVVFFVAGAALFPSDLGYTDTLVTLFG